MSMNNLGKQIKKKLEESGGSKSLCPSCKWPEWLSTLIEHEPCRLNMDIAALNDDCIPEEGSLKEQITGYTLYWSGGLPALASWAIASKLEDLPTTHSEGVCCFTQSRNLPSPSPAPSFSRKMTRLSGCLKTAWMHTRCKRYYLIDYIHVRQGDLQCPAHARTSQCSLSFWPLSCQLQTKAQIQTKAKAEGEHQARRFRLAASSQTRSKQNLSQSFSWGSSPFYGSLCRGFMGLPKNSNPSVLLRCFGIYLQGNYKLVRWPQPGGIAGVEKSCPSSIPRQAIMSREQIGLICSTLQRNLRETGNVELPNLAARSPFCADTGGYFGFCEALAAVYGIHPKQIVRALSDAFQQKPLIQM